MYAKMKFFDKTATGRIVNRIASDVLAVDDQLPWFCHCLFEDIAYCLGLPIGLMILSPYMIIFFIAIIFLIYLVYRDFRVANREIKRLSSVNNGIVLTNIGETCKGLVLIRSMDKK